MINNLPPFELVAFSEQFNETLNSLDTGEALSWLDCHIKYTIQMRDYYQAEMFKTANDDPKLPGIAHAYWVDSNNLYRLKILQDEIKKELG